MYAGNTKDIGEPNAARWPWVEDWLTQFLPFFLTLSSHNITTSFAQATTVFMEQV
jgi:hypothetical protein